MKKTLYFFSSILILALSFNFTSFNDDNIADVLSVYDGPNWTPQMDTGITCTPGGIQNDDGTFENGYRSTSTGDSTTFVHKMVMPIGGNVNITRMCWSWTASGPNASGVTNHQLVVYDTTGAGGVPGNVPVAVVSGVNSPNIPGFPSHAWYGQAVNITGLTNRAYYIGIKWNNNPIINAFTSSDENSATASLGYQRNTTTFPPTWTAANIGFPNYKNMSYRIEATNVVSGGGPQINLCRGGLNLLVQDMATTRDSVLLVLNPNCIVSDVNVRIDTLIHTWDADVSVYLQKGNIGVKIINQVGGSGDNFIGTILNDSAATPIASGTAPFTGSFRPSNPLTPFNTTQAAGYWKIVVTDSGAGDTGMLRRWCAVVTHSICEGVTNTIEIPNHYLLSQNYPNPFNPVTKIKYGLPENAFVRLVVYDILGREVAVLVNEQKSANTYEVEFDASHLSSGVYFYKMEAGSYALTKKMLVVK